MVSTIGLILDIAVVAIFVIFGIIGLKKGLLKSVLSIFSWGLCILIAFLTAKYVATWINGLYNFSGLIGNKISKSLVNMNAYFALPINTFAGKEALIEAIPSNTNKLLTQLIKSVFSSNKVDMTSTNTIGNVVGSSLGHICFVVITGILVFIVLKIAVALLSKLFKNIEQTKVLGGLNKVLGLVLGLLKATLIVGAINVVLVAITLAPGVNKVITPLIQDNTYVEKVVYNTTDKLFGKYIVEGDTVQNFVGKLWDNRK